MYFSRLAPAKSDKTEHVNSTASSPLSSAELNSNSKNKFQAEILMCSVSFSLVFY